MTDLAAALRKLRFEKFTQDQVAKKIGVSTRAYARYESGEKKPSLEMCIKLAKLYKITVDEILHMADPSYEMNEPKVSDYKKLTVASVIVPLDGTKKTLEDWILKLTNINAAL